MPRGAHRSDQRAQRSHAAQRAHHLHLRYFPLHVLRPLRRCLPRGRARTHTGFRNGHVHARRPDLGPPDAGRGAESHPIQMLIDTVLFYIFALLVLGGGLLTITRRNAVHSAISLIVSLLGVAGLYLLQQAEFLFAVQIVLYVGGIMVLFLFVIMLVNLDQAAKERQFNKQWLIALVAVTVVGAQVGYFVKGQRRVPDRRGRAPRGY